MRRTAIIAILTLAALLLATAAAAALAQTTAAPSVTALSITSRPAADSTYAKGETISVQVTFSGSVTVASGTPELTLLVGHSSTRRAEYASGSGTNTLTFSYTVRAGDWAPNGIIIVRNGIHGNIVQTGTTTPAILTYAVVPANPAHKVNGGPQPPRFPHVELVPPQTYTKGAAVSLTLPAAVGGAAPLTYALTGPSSTSQLPAGLAFNTTTRILSGTTTGWQAVTRYTYTATDANQNAATMPLDITVNADFDADNDQLIEVHNLAQLNAIRWDLNGDGVSSQTATIQAGYRAAYPGIAGMGCKSVDHDNTTTTPNQPVCIGYELNNNLDFDTDGDGIIYTDAFHTRNSEDHLGDPGDSYYNGGRGWTPIGDQANPFTAIFDGQNKTIANLFINSTGTNALADLGLFGVIGKCDANGNNCRGEVKNLGLLNADVTRNHSLLGNVGTLAGRLYGSVTGCYAVGGSVDHNIPANKIVGGTGGLIGNVHKGNITASYAKVSVISRGKGNVRTGGLAGRNTGTITVSYATGDVNGSGKAFAGGLVGLNIDGGSIIASYAAGSVSSPHYPRSYAVGGLAGNNYTASSTITASYAIGTLNSIYSKGLSGGGTISGSYWDIGGTGVFTGSGTGTTATQLQSPTSNTGIYAAWSADQWDFGTARQYPAVKHNGKLVPGQRETTIRADNPRAPVVGEPVVATLNVAGATSTAWQWQSSAGGAAWNDIRNATGTTYIPVAADVTRHLRAKVAFTASSTSRTATTFNTPKVIAAPAALAAAAPNAISLTPVIGSAKIRFTLSAPGAANPSIWRWQRCNDAAMQTACQFVTSSEPTSNAYTEYTPTAADAGKYLQAYVYYADANNANAWTQAKTPILGPVAAAPAAPAPSP